MAAERLHKAKRAVFLSEVIPKPTPRCNHARIRENNHLTGFGRASVNGPRCTPLITALSGNEPTAAS
jgi:hypothetical protein